MLFDWAVACSCIVSNRRQGRKVKLSNSEMASWILVRLAWCGLILAGLQVVQLQVEAFPSYGLVELQSVLNKLPSYHEVQVDGLAKVDIVVGTFIIPNQTEVDFQRSLIQRQLDVLSHTLGNVVSITHVFVLCVGSDIFGDDVIHVMCEEGYQDLFLKTYSFWTTISSLIPAHFYAKRDADAQICWLPVIRQLLKQAYVGQSIYMGGYTTNANVYADPNHRWHDKFLVNLAPQQRHYWPYMQGAFYLLSADLVKKLELVKDKLQTLAMEDTMVGAWLLPFRKAIVHLTMEHRCHCELNHADVFHKCTNDNYMGACSEEQHMQYCFGNSNIAGRILEMRENYLHPSPEGFTPEEEEADMSEEGVDV